MPAASICDSISVALKCSLEPTKSGDDMTANLMGSSSRILQTKVEYEETEDYRVAMIDHLKSKYLVLGLPENSDTKKTPESSSNQAKKESTKLGIPEATVILYPANKVQLGWRDDFPVGAGMSNVGNTCYLNSTLQALLHVPALVNWLISDPHHKGKCEINVDGRECLTCAMAKTLHFSHLKSNDVIKPYCIYNKLKFICRTMTFGEQEDAHEFLRYLLSGLEKSYIARSKATKLDNYSKETTPINQIFGGYLRSEVKCLQCGHISTTFQHFQEIPVDIRNAGTLEEAFASYFSKEKLDNNYKCEACKRRVPATKQFSLERPPKVLCVQLKRFSFSSGKIQRHIAYKSTVDMGPYLWIENGAPRKKLSYKLMSMVSHVGASVHCGHYTAVAQVSSGKYYSFDDACVRPISANNFMNTNAYIMIFELESDSYFQSHSPKPNGVPVSNGFVSSTNNSPIKRITPKMVSSQATSKGKEIVSPPSKEPQRFIGPVLPASMKQPENGKSLNKNNSLVPYEGSSDEEETKPESSTKTVQSNNVGTPEKVESRVSFSKDKTEKTTNGNGVHRWDKSSPSPSNGTVTNGHSETKTNGFHKEQKTVEQDAKEKWKAKFGPDEVIATKASGSKSDSVVASTTNGWMVTDNKEESRKSDNNSVNNAAAIRPFDGTNRSDTADRLSKMSHWGYGNSSVTSWDGNKSLVEREVENDRHQSRKRFLDENEDDDDDDFNRGRVKKVKNQYNRSYERPYKSNPFQEYQSNNKNYNSGSYPYYNQRYYNTSKYYYGKPNNFHRNRNRNQYGKYNGRYR